MHPQLLTLSDACINHLELQVTILLSRVAVLEANLVRSSLFFSFPDVHILLPLTSEADSPYDASDANSVTLTVNSCLLSVLLFMMHCFYSRCSYI